MYKKLKELKKLIASLNSCVVAFSGGVDSAFLAKVVYDVLGKKSLAVTAVSPLYPEDELSEAKSLAKLIGIKHIIIKSNELKIKEFRDNPLNRCYYCKKELFSKLWKIANKFKMKHVIDGSTYSDINDFRPGIKALEELEVISPLKQVKLTKPEIRRLSKELGLRTWDKGSFACLASRFPYGTKITKKKLKMVEVSESFIKRLGIKQLRVRYHNKLARIEVSPKDFEIIMKNRDKIVKGLKKVGFFYITLDLLGYRTGSMNEPWIKRI